MLVYGDHIALEHACDVFDEVRQRLCMAAGLAPGIARHASLVSAFIRLGELLQGIADLEFEISQIDITSPTQQRVSQDLCRLAMIIGCSWQSKFVSPLPVPPSHGRLPHQIPIKNLEGYTFYAV